MLAQDIPLVCNRTTKGLEGLFYYVNKGTLRQLNIEINVLVYIFTCYAENFESIPLIDGEIKW